MEEEEEEEGAKVKFPADASFCGKANKSSRREKGRAVKIEFRETMEGHSKFPKQMGKNVGKKPSQLDIAVEGYKLISFYPYGIFSLVKEKTEKERESKRVAV